METIDNWKIKRLIELGKDFDCEFYNPPFQGNIEEASFDIHKLKETKKFQEFLAVILSLKLHYEYAKHKKHIYMTIKIKE